MLPNDALSSAPVTGVLLTPDSQVQHRLIDYERGGIALNDSTQGIDLQTWTAYVSGDDIFVAPESGGQTLLLHVNGISTLSLAFDQNMRPVLAYTAPDGAHLRYFDTITSMTIDAIITGATFPRVTHDDKRISQSGPSDVICAYLRAGNLYYRQQRDRYLIERLLASGVHGRLRNIGMSTVGRLQFEMS